MPATAGRRQVWAHHYLVSRRSVVIVVEPDLRQLPRGAADEREVAAVERTAESGRRASL